MSATPASGWVDCHTHTLPRHWPDLTERYGDGRWPVLRALDSCSAEVLVGGAHFRTVPHTCWDAAARITQMDATGISTQWLSPTPVMFNYWAPPRQCAEMARYVNDGIADMVRHAPDRFVGLATLPLGDPDLAIAELERAVDELGLNGVEIGTNVNGSELDDPMLLPVFAALAAWNVPVFVHPWDVRNADRLSRYNAMYTIGMPTETAYAALALLLGGVLDRFPDLRVMLAHGAGVLVWLLPRLDRGWSTWPDRRGQAEQPPSSIARRRLWVDSLIGDEANLKLIGSRLGWERVVLGSDYPFPIGDERPGAALYESSLDADTKHALLSANASVLLGAPAGCASAGSYGPDLINDTIEVEHGS